MPSERGPSAGSECARSVFNPSLDPVGHPLGVRQPLNTTIIKPAPCFRPSAAGATAAPDRVTPLSEAVWKQSLYKRRPYVICGARLRTDLLDNRSLAMLLEISKRLIYQTLVSGQPLTAVRPAI